MVIQLTRRYFLSMESLQNLLDTLGGIVWGPFFLIPLLLGTGLYLTIRLGGIQFFTLGRALRHGLIVQQMMEGLLESAATGHEVRLDDADL